MMSGLEAGHALISVAERALAADVPEPALLFFAGARVLCRGDVGATIPIAIGISEAHKQVRSGSTR